MAGDNEKPASDALEMAQSWQPESYQEHAGFVAVLGNAVLELLAPRAGEDILDLGCGDGVLTRKLSEMGCRAVGVDASAEQIRGAREQGLDAHVMDGGALSFEHEFDAVFSNAALHWMLDPDAVIAGVTRALKPGGRFVAEFGGARNVEKIRLALESALDDRGLDGAAYNPWYFPDQKEYAARLNDAGFIIDTMELIDRPTPLPGDVTGWLATFGESYLKAVPESERAALLADVRNRLEPQIKDADGIWVADYVRLRFSARLSR